MCRYTHVCSGRRRLSRGGLSCFSWGRARVSWATGCGTVGRRVVWYRSPPATCSLRHGIYVHIYMSWAFYKYTLRESRSPGKLKNVGAGCQSDSWTDSVGIHMHIFKRRAVGACILPACCHVWPTKKQQQKQQQPEVEAGQCISASTHHSRRSTCGEKYVTVAADSDIGLFPRVPS